MRIERRGGNLLCTERRYWSVQGAIDDPENQSDALATDDDATLALDRLLCQVVADEACADVPVGAFLSGGIDSSLIASIMQRVSGDSVSTFTIGFDEAQFDESAQAEAIAAHLGTRHTTIRLSGSDALGHIGSLADIFDEPFADSSQLPTLLVCGETRKHVTVALSGDGGDELFGGYSQYINPDSIGRLAARIPRALRSTIGRGVELLPDSAVGMLQPGVAWPMNSKARISQTLRFSDERGSYEMLLSEWLAPDRVLTSSRRIRRSKHLSVAWPSATTPEEARMAYDLQTYLPDDILVKVDRCAMSVSLETRAPLLDHRVVEFALRQPLSRKVRDRKGKFLLRALLERYVPKPLWDRPKRGFAIPLASWLREDLRQWSSDMLFDGGIVDDWFDRTMTQRVWNEHQAGSDHAGRLWRLLMVAQWLRAQRPC